MHPLHRLLHKQLVRRHKCRHKILGTIKTGQPVDFHILTTVMHCKNMASSALILQCTMQCLFFAVFLSWCNVVSSCSSRAALDTGCTIPAPARNQPSFSYPARARFGRWTWSRIYSHVPSTLVLTFQPIPSNKFPLSTAFFAENATYVHMLLNVIATTECDD